MDVGITWHNGCRYNRHSGCQYNLAQWMSVQPGTMDVSTTWHNGCQYNLAQSMSVQSGTMDVSITRHNGCQYNLAQWMSVQPGTMDVSTAWHNCSPLPFPKRQIVDSSKLKELADNNSKFDKNEGDFSKRVENTVGKGEIAHYEQFLLFPQCFQMICFAET